MDLNFNNATPPISSEKKIFNKSIQYVKDTNGVWGLDSTYTLPDVSGFPTAEGYEANWVYQGTNTPVTVNDIITTTGTSVNLTPGLSPLDPVVKGTVNGVIVSDGDRSGNWVKFAVAVPDVYSPTYPTIGVEIIHPLLTPDSSGNYVYFRYAWLDIQNNMNGSRHGTSPFFQITAVKDIDIRGTFDFRDGGDRYELVVYGYYFNNTSKAATQFYQSTNSGISFTGANNAGATDSTIFYFGVGNYTPTNITYNLSGGNVGGSTSDIVWQDVSAATLGDHGTIPVPVRTNHTLAGWKDSITDAVIAPENMASQPVTVTKTYTAQWDKDSYKVTFDSGANGVLWDGSSDQSEIIEYVDHNDNVTAVPIVKADKGYEFFRWMKDNDGSYLTDAAVLAELITADTEFVAHYQNLLITAVAPAGDYSGSGFPVTTDKVSVTFNREMNASVGYPGTVTLDNGAVLTNGTWSFDNKTITFDLSDLTYSTTYNYTIKDFKSINGGVIADSVNVYNFKTEAAPIPQIISVIPVGDNGGSGHPITTNTVTIGFDLEMNTSSGYPGTVTLDNGAVLANGIWSIDNKTVTFDLSDLAYSTTYNYTIKNFESKDGGIILDSVSVYNFTTEASPKPLIVSVAPEGDNSGSGYSIATDKISVTFNMEMNTSSGYPGTVTLDNGAVLTNGAWSLDNKTITFDLSDLTYSTTYNYTVKNFKSANEIAMDDSINAYNFTTFDRPVITTVTPIGDNSGSGFPITTDEVSVTFDMEMNASAGYPGTLTLDNGAVLTNGAWSLDNKTITFDLSGLTYSTTYNYTIKDFESEDGGIILDSVSVYNFTTMAPPKPQIFSITPDGDNGGSGYPIATNTVTIVFDMEMNTSAGAIGTVTLDNGAVLTGGTWNADKKTINYTLSDLTYSETYKYSVSGFESIYNTVMDLDNAHWFETESDLIPPNAIAATPNGTGISITAGSASITFDKMMDATVAGSVTLDNGAVLNPSSGIWSNDNKTITYNLSNLTYSTTYNYSISGFKDTAGNSMVTPHQDFNFTTESDKTKPVAVNAVPGGSNVAVTTDSASISFNKEMNTTSGLGTVTLNNGAVLTGGTWGSDKKTITYVLSGLTYSTAYTFSIRDFEDTAGNTMVIPHAVFNFTTAPDTVQPVAVSASPSGVNISVSTSTASITFNKEMNASSGFPGTVTLDNGASLTSGSWSPDNKTITYALSGLAASTTYTFDIKDFEDTFGNTMVIPHAVFNFTTENNPAAPNVIRVTPNGTGIAVSTNSASITFDKEMDTSVSGTVTLDNGAVLNNGVWTDSRTITYDLSNLNYSTTYTYTIAGFEDSFNNLMNTPIPNFTFRTVNSNNTSGGGGGGSGGGTIIDPDAEDKEDPKEDESGNNGNGGSQMGGTDGGQMGGYEEDLPQLPLIVLFYLTAVAAFVFYRCEEE